MLYLTEFRRTTSRRNKFWVQNILKEIILKENLNAKLKYLSYPRSSRITRTTLNMAISSIVFFINLDHQSGMKGINSEVSTWGGKEAFH